MTSEERLKRAYELIAERKAKLEKYGISEPSVFENTVREFFSPVLISLVKLAFPKSDAVLLGETKPKDIKRLTSDYPVIYAPAHRGTFDVPRIIAHGVPHSCYVVGDERVFYCTINKILFDALGVMYFDRDDPKDRNLAIERASKILSSSSLFGKNNSVIINPEGVPNVYGNENLQLYPGIIKMALNVGSVIVPLGNEIHIKWNKEGTKIIGDTNYMMYEDYNEMPLYRPSNDIGLSQMHKELGKANYISATQDSHMEEFIYGNHFRIYDIDFSLEDKLFDFLETHPIIRDFVEYLKNIESINMTPIIEYLKRCVIIRDLNNRHIECLNILDKRMRVLSDKVNAEIAIRHPRTEEECERDSHKYIDFYLKNVEKTGKKGPTTAEVEIDHFINHVTDEKIIASETIKILEGLHMLLDFYKNSQIEQLYNSCHDYALSIKKL